MILYARILIYNMEAQRSLILSARILIYSMEAQRSLFKNNSVAIYRESLEYPFHHFLLPAPDSFPEGIF